MEEKKRFENYLNVDSYRLLGFLTMPRTISEVMAKFDVSQGYVWQKMIRLQGQGLIIRSIDKGRAKSYVVEKNNYKEYLELYEQRGMVG